MQQQFQFKLLYFFCFAALGVYQPYVPVFFQVLLLSKYEIGILCMIPNFSSALVAPIWSFISDKFSIHSEVIFLALLISSMLSICMLFVRSFALQALMVTLCSIFRAPITPLVDSIVIAILDKTGDSASYGSMRLWGAVSFGMFSFFGGYLLTLQTKLNPYVVIFFLYSLLSFVTGFIILVLVRNKTISTAFTCSEPSYSSRESISVSEALWNIVRSQPSVGLFCVIVFLSGIGSGVIDSFLFIRLGQLGGSGLLMGISRFITCAAEVPMFQVAGALQDKLGVWNLLIITQIAFVIRFCYYSMLSNPWFVLPCELLHGFTFAVTVRFHQTLCPALLKQSHNLPLLDRTRPYSNSRYSRQNTRSIFDLFSWQLCAVERRLQLCQLDFAPRG